MAFSKSYIYPKDLQQQAFYMKALGHPERLSIIQLLRSSGSQCVTTIAQNSPLHFAAVSQHLAILRKSRLVTYEEHFPFTFYAVDDHVYSNAAEKLCAFFTEGS